MKLSNLIRKCLIFSIGILLLSACRKPKIIEVDLPEHDPILIVEGYLEPGLPKTVIIQQSTGYFDAPEIKLITNAFVTISNGIRTDTLKYIPLELGPFQLGVYTSLDSGAIMKEDYDHIYTLNVVAKLQNGETRTASATTRLLRPVPVVETKHVFDGRPEKRAYITGYYNDPAGERNYYRMIFTNPSTSIYPLPQGQTFRDSVTDYIFSDDLTNGQYVPFGSPPFFEPGEEVRIKLMHITPEYYDYMISYQSAVAGNGSPFVEPFNIRSNIQGEKVSGIFTTLSYILYRDTIPE